MDPFHGWCISTGLMTQKQNFAQNLRHLCSQHRSVSEVCRRLEINRQQFNKYLAGSALPSAHTMARICEFFTVAESEILASPEAFANGSTARHRTPHSVETLLFGPTISHLAEKFPDSHRKLERYIGYYHAHYCSPAFPGRIIRSLSHIFRKGDHFYDRTIERLVDRRRPTSRYPVNKYTGSVVHTEDRICIAHFNMFMHQTLSLLAFYPSYRPMVQRLSGVFVSVSSGPGRQPFAARVVYEYLGEKPNLREAIETAELRRQEFRHP
jgi:transcriptional regulator with XRE-family HTH domain